MGVHVIWDCEHPKTPEGFYHLQAGIDFAIAKSLAVAPFADLLWMETKTADLEDAEKFAHAIHAQYPDKMLAYNLSPSFSWDTTGMNDEQMKRFPEELGKARLRLQLHYLRRPPDRRPRCRGVRDRPEAGWHARPGAPAAQVQTDRVALSHAANAGRRSSPRRRPDGLVGTHRSNEGHGQGLDSVSAPGPDRGSNQVA